MPERVSTPLKLPVPGQVDVTVKVDSPADDRPGTPAVILAHGSNNNLDFSLLVYLAERLAKTGRAVVVRFNFPYVERGTSSPDPRSVLESAMMAVYQYVLRELAGAGTPVIVGGKSLGGRTAAELVSRGPEGGGVSAAGLVLLGYPLHSPGRQERLYLESLRHIDIPSLFFVGTRDPLCEPGLLRPVVAGLLHPGEIHVVEGGDHSLHVPRSSKRQPEESYPAVAERLETFLERATG
jgi:predicted alpha/beta-hydrolase family hydrolase